METQLMERLGYIPLGIRGDTPKLPAEWVTYTSTTSEIVYAGIPDHTAEIERLKKQIKKLERTAPARAYALSQQLERMTT